MQHTILLIDDAQDDQEIIRVALGRSYNVLLAPTLSDAEMQLKDPKIDLILLDVHLPDGDGFKFCASLKTRDSTKAIPVIFITSRTDVPDRVMGFSLGAEDYICKPFDGTELRARVDTRLKKIKEGKEQDLSWVKGNLRINVSLQRVYLLRTDGGEAPLELTPLEFKLLCYLARHEDHVFTRDQMMDAVWGKELHVLDRTVDMHVSNLRRKLTDSRFTIKSVHGVGYRFICKP